MLESFARCSRDIGESLKLALKADENEYLSVGLLMGMDFYHALECLRLFRQNHPGINLHLYRASSDELTEDILTGESDAVLLFDNHLDNISGFEHEPLFPSRLMYVLSSKHPLAGRCELTVQDLSGCEFIFSNNGQIDDPGIFGHITKTAQALGIRREQVRFCRNFESIFAEVATGYSITLVDEYVSYLSDRYSLISTGLGHNVVVAWKVGTCTPQLNRLIEYLKRELSQSIST